MDKVTKFLAKLSTKEQNAFFLLMNQLKSDYRSVPGLKPLARRKGWYRVRLGQYRLIFSVDSKKQVHIQRISKRDERTYKNL